MATWVGALLLCGAACNDGPRDEDSDPLPTGASESDSSPTSGTASAGSVSGTSESTTGSAPGSSSSSSSGMDTLVLDVAFGTGDTEAETKGSEEGCRKVDFLFVIDNSGSMGGEQDNLIASFPGFIDTIQSTIQDAQDYHIMVIDSDPWLFEGCEAACDANCVDANNICPVLPPAPFECFVPCAIYGAGCFADYQCDVTEPLECEDVLGAGVVHPRGSEATNQDCDFASGRRYMDSSEPDLGSAFACAAKVGIGSTSSTERPMEAMVQAATPQTDAFVCNEGFIRDDAILVVTFITDEDDGNGDSSGTVEGWRQALIAAKNGDESAVVVLGLFGDNDMAGSICPPVDDDPDTFEEAEPSERLRNFVNSWGERGFAGSVCANSYNDFFTEAVGIIDTTCEDFTPPEG